jgi:deoxycytidine triphosphate deaminase
LWIDPFPEAERGYVLLSDQIRFFIETIDLVSNEDGLPIALDAVRPAAFDLHVGTEYYEDDQSKALTTEQWFEIPPNGLVYVRTRERFNLPYYLVARYSLQVTQVYRGLLIDNGLHIDPGYKGYIWIPVHNYTTQPRVLKEGEVFLSMEFNRTTSLPPAVVQFRNEGDLVLAADRQLLVGFDSKAITLFNKSPEDCLKIRSQSPRSFWNRKPGETHKSRDDGY